MKKMDILTENHDKIRYTAPSVTLIEINTDVITTSSGDPNMGEWDTEI